MIEDAEQVAQLPWVRAIRPMRAPYREPLSPNSTLVVWHVDVEFQEWTIPPELTARWREKEPNNNETWRKRPLVIGTDSGCKYSCGEVELAARLRRAGFSAQWVSEWSVYPHVDCWRKYCVKRNEIEDDAPELWAFDHNLRARSERKGGELGRSGGHPDIAAWKTGKQDFVFMEYKGPDDKMKKKQEEWARALLDETPDRVAYLAVRGIVSR
jgi:hypothetical protein